MDEEQANAAASEAADADAQDAGDGSEGNEEAAEGTTPEEVAQVLKGAGMDVKVPAAAPAADEEAKEVAPDADDDAGEEEAAPAEEAKPAEEAAKPEAPTDEEAPSFTMTIEDVNGQSYSISADDNLSDVLEDFEPKNNGQILDILDKFRDLKDSKKSYDSEQATKAADDEKQEAISKILSGWDREIDQLVADKRLDSKEADRVGEVREFMSNENSKRETDGRPLIGSFEDALDKLEAIEAREAAAQAKKDAKDTARKNGGMVGGSSAPASGKQQAYRVGSARNVNEAIRAAGLL
jgi:hypothetical protein